MEEIEENSEEEEQSPIDRHSGRLFGFLSQ